MMTKERITCREYCNKWNDIDKDCEIYGEHHPCPRKCTIYKNGLIIEDNTPHKESTVLFYEKEQTDELV